MSFQVFMSSELSITTDYVTDTGDPRKYLRAISEAGFSHVLWCHQFNSDHLYSTNEITHISGLLNEFNLKVLDLHASEGRQKYWLSSDESTRESGLELVKNRIHMASELSSDAIMLHYRHKLDRDHNTDHWDRLYKSLDELQPYAKSHGVRIALENSQFHIDPNKMAETIRNYPSEFLGFCYDPGHSNIQQDLPLLEMLLDRLISVHLNDNDGVDDQHKLLFSGNVNWERLAQLLAKSSYDGPVSMEVIMKNHSEIESEGDFLSQAHRTGKQFTEMIQNQSINS